MAEMHVIGPPGTGKTTDLARQIDHAAQFYGSDRVVVTSMTRSAAAELSSRGLMVNREHVGTLHRLCYHLLGRPELADVRVADFNQAYPAFAVTPEASGPEDDRPDGPRGETYYDPVRARVNLLRARMADASAYNADERAWYGAWCAFKADTGTTDFTDWLETALADVALAPGAPDAIFGDEVQDYSRLELTLLRKWGAEARSLVLAGDADQAIYEWRGADPGVFVNFDPGYSEDGRSRRKTLEQSYRVPREVHRVASAWIKHVRGPRIDAMYLPRADDGAVVPYHPARWKFPEPVLGHVENCLKTRQTLIIAASCDYMLAPIIAILRREGIPFANPWRTKNGGWNPLASRKNAVSMAERLLAFLRPDIATYGEDGAHQWGAEDLRRWTKHLAASGILRRGAKAEIDALGTPNDVEVDLADLHRWLEEDAFDRALELDVSWWLRSLLESKRAPARFPVNVYQRRGPAALRDDPVIYVGTIHSFKGAEADHVILFPDLSPAGAGEWWGTDRQHDAVRRLFYVGMTRARQTLALASPATKYAVQW